MRNIWERLVEKYIPEEDREGFVFHAVDIWNNHGYFADKRVWPREKCWEILWDLAMFPALFVLPIAVGLKLRPEVADWIKEPVERIEKKYRRKAHDVALHGLAFVDFTYGVENVMRKHWADEVAELVAENWREVHDSLQGIHFNMKSKKWFAAEWTNPPPEFPLVRIRGAIKFAAKKDEPALQIADVCAYFIRAAIEGSRDHAPFYNRLQFSMLAHPKGRIWASRRSGLGGL